MREGAAASQHEMEVVRLSLRPLYSGRKSPRYPLNRRQVSSSASLDGAEESSLAYKKPELNSIQMAGGGGSRRIQNV